MISHYPEEHHHPSVYSVHLFETKSFHQLTIPNLPIMRFTWIATGVFCFLSSVAAQPPRDSPADACCCCDISSNVISCDRSILKKDCVCAAVACAANAPTVYTDSQAPPTAAVKKPETRPAQQTRAPSVERTGVPDTADACCCCDIRRSVISCSRSIGKDECFCAAVMCPQGVPVVWADDDKSVSDEDAVRPPPSLPVENLPPPLDGPVAKQPTPVATTEAPHAIPSTKGKPPGLNNRPKRFVTVAKPAQPKPMPLGCLAPSSASTRRFNCCCCNPGKNQVVCQLREQQDCVCAAVACPMDAETVHVQPPVCTNI